MKDPAFLFYPNDYLGGTMGMSFEEKGAYIELLMTQFNRGHMTSDMVGQVVGQLFGQIKDKFKIDADGLYYNARLDLEIEKRKNFVASRLNNISGNNQYTKNKGHKGNHIGGHMTSHMEDENRNEDIDIDKGVKGEKKIHESELNLFFESVWLLYPKKEGKGSINKTQKEVLYKIGYDELKRCVDRYLLVKKGTERQFLQMGSTFYNSGYVDYLDKNYVQTEIQEESGDLKQVGRNVYKL